MSTFYSVLFRMKYIDRWALMRNTEKESLFDHTLCTAYIAHALCVIEKERLKNTEINTEKVVLSALYHDTAEVITGDMPTPVKYFDNDIKAAYKKIEGIAEEKLLSLLPEDFKPYMESAYNMDEETAKIVKAADKISALIKCEQELSFNNIEFKEAKKTVEKSIKDMHLASADIFIKEFLPSFKLSLDNQTK